MDHENAVTAGLTEKYVLGELEDAEREAFEAHFFGCAACAEDVKAAAALADGIRSRPRPRPARRPVFWPMPLGAAAALALCAGATLFQALEVVPRLRQELREADTLQAAPSFFLYASRSELPVVSVPAGSRRLTLRLGADSDLTFPAYRCELRDAAGRVHQSGRVAAPPRGEELQVLLPLAGIPAGSYEIGLDGLDGPGAAAEVRGVARYRFTLRYTEE